MYIPLRFGLEPTEFSRTYVYIAMHVCIYCTLIIILYNLSPGSSLAAPVHPLHSSLPPTLSSWTTSQVQHPPIWAPATTQNFSHSEPRSSSHLPHTSDVLTFDRDNSRPHLPPSAAVDTRTFIGRPPPPPAPSGESFAVFSQNHGLPTTQQLLPPPTAGGVHHTTAASAVVGSAEYDAAMELEMWKLAEEENFQERLKEREKTHMAKLGERECPCVCPLKS